MFWSRLILGALRLYLFIYFEGITLEPPLGCVSTSCPSPKLTTVLLILSRRMTERKCDQRKYDTLHK